MSFSGPQTNNPLTGAVKKNSNGVAFTDDGTDQDERRMLRFG
jgi:hypothetical protein